MGFNLSKIKENQIPELRRKLGIVFQRLQLLQDRNVNNNLLFVMKATGWKGKKVIQNKISELLEKVEMSDKAKSYPHLISGGEQQRIAIARALINDPKIIIADEPTGNLDPDTSKKIMSLIKSISSEEQTIVMATHDYDIIEQFPGRIIQFQNKSIEE